MAEGELRVRKLLDALDESEARVRELEANYRHASGNWSACAFDLSQQKARAEQAEARVRELEATVEECLSGTYTIRLEQENEALTTQLRDLEAAYSEEYLLGELRDAQRIVRAIMKAAENDPDVNLKDELAWDAQAWLNGLYCGVGELNDD